LIAQAATLEARVPIMHFFDGFRISHEVAKIEQVSAEVVREMIDDELVFAHRSRALTPDHPFIRGTSQNPDVYFQARESVNPFYLQMPGIMQGVMDKFATLTGRQYRLYEYIGAPDAERIIILMGSGAEAVQEVVNHINHHNEKVGVVIVRLFRPFAAEKLLNIIPASAKKIAVLDRCKEPGADGEPLYKDVVTAISEAFSGGTSRFTTFPRVVGGRYGLSSKEFTPGMIKSVFDELKKAQPKNHFTIGITDDLTNTSLEWDENFRTDAGEGVTRCMFFGLGADGTVGANKNTIKILGEETELYGQGYFVYDSKKAGAATISHLRFSPEPIHSPYLIGSNEAHFIGCHQPVFLDRYDMLDYAEDGAVFLLNTPAAPDKVWDLLTKKLQQQIIQKKIEFYVIDAYAIARQTGMGNRINTIMQTCFFAISGVLPRDVAIAKIKHAAEKSYSKKGSAVVEANWQAIDETIANMHKVVVPARVTSTLEMPQQVPASAPEFVRKVIAEIMSGRGDKLPVSALPNDGTWPSGTAMWDKRNLAQEIPVWDEELCIHCGKCPFVCPHSAIRSKLFAEGLTKNAPPTFKHVQVKGKDYEQGLHISYQVAPEDCTGCKLCVEICPAVSKVDGHRALEMVPIAPLRDQERLNFEFFLSLPEYDRHLLKTNIMKSAMMLQPLFEFPTACIGCGETSYIRLASQLFGDRMLVANATGCSSIYGGNLPTTPYCKNLEGRGPAWSNSLFEDNAEFGLGYRVSIDKHAEHATELLELMKDKVGAELADAIISTHQTTEADIFAQRDRIEKLKQKLKTIDTAEARQLTSLAEYLVKKSVWIIGGDGWAYDIGFGGLDHVISTGRNVNILVLDTEVYSNTGGQMSKATPRGAIAKFAAGGKHTGKKDLAQIAISYGHVYVAQVAYGAKDVHTLRTFIEAESYDGPSIIIAYGPCGEHGYDLSQQHQQQELAVKSGHWLLFRYDPRRAQEGKNPMSLDSPKPSVPYREFIKNEPRFRGLLQEMDEDGGALQTYYDNQLRQHYAVYERMAECGDMEIKSEINKSAES
jgi:pyruvate-ferredoxin/flavodoxin oxidoreductase